MSLRTKDKCQCCEQILHEMYSLKKYFKKYIEYSMKQLETLHILIVNTSLNNKNGVNANNLPMDESYSRDFTEERICEETITQNLQQSPSYESAHESEAAPLKKNQLQQNYKLEVCKNTTDSHTTVKDANILEINDVQQGRASAFYSVRSQVLPAIPFETVDEFEIWDSLLANDENHRNELSKELLEGHFLNAKSYIKHIWEIIFSDEIAENFSYIGNPKRNKKSIKQYVFTAIFMKCFLQRFPHLDEKIFSDRTKCFFNYANDRIRKNLISGQNIEMCLDISDYSEKHDPNYDVQPLNR